MTDQARMDGTANRLTLKWGTLKGWNLQSKKAQEIFRRYAELGMSMGAMQQADTPEQKQLICDLIDAVDGPIDNDWTGETMTKEAAKKYVMEYGQKSAQPKP